MFKFKVPFRFLVSACFLLAGSAIYGQKNSEKVFSADEKLKMVSSIPLEKRERIFPETRIFPRFQSKYSLIQNYLDGYCRDIFTDRPLFFDRSLAGSHTGEYNKLNIPESFVRQLIISREFADGLGLLFDLPNYQTRTIKGLLYTDNAGIKNAILLEITPDIFQTPELLDESIEIALSSPAAVKHQGKLIVSSYWGERMSPKDWKKNLERIRLKYPDKTLFMIEPRSTCYALNGEYLRGGGKIPQSKINEAREKLRAYLDVADGVMFAGSNHIISDSKDYPGHIFNENAYGKFIVPLMVSVVNEPAYRNKKLLALSAHKTYFSRKMIWVSVDEEGTRSLRRSLEIALSANPDYIVMPEWNEINENTHIEPTVSDAQANRRVINAIRKRSTPEISRMYPNLILSFRQDNAFGEMLPIELLGLPDSNAPCQKYQVQLRLFDNNGKLVREFPEETFDHSKILEKFYSIASEDFAGHRFFLPELKITTEGKEQLIRRGLPQIRFCTPPNYNLKYVKIPLRDLPDPEKISVAWKINGDKIQVDGQAEVAGLINSIELLANDIPLAAVDPKNEYQAPPGQILLRLNRWTTNTSKWFNDIWRIQAVRGAITGRTTHQIALSGMAVPKQSGQILQGKIGGGSAIRELFFYATPDAELEVEMRGEKIKVNVADIIKNQIYRRTQDNAVSWSIEMVNELPEMPFPLRLKSCRFSLSATKYDVPNPVYQLRIVTMEGQVFRSEPFYPEKYCGKTVKMPLYSRLKKQVVQINVPVELARDISYRFVSEAGNVLLSSPAYRSYYANGGGYNFWLKHAKSYFAEKTASPVWGQDDSRNVLNFTPGSYLMLPAEVFSRAAFTLNMNFQVKNIQNQFLLGVAGESIEVKVKNGSLSGFLTTAEGNFPWKTDPVIEADKWYDLSIVYDLNSLKLFLDGRIIGEFPVKGVFVKGSVLLIGNYSTVPGQPEFNGSLRALSISNFINPK